MHGRPTETPLEQRIIFGYSYGPASDRITVAELRAAVERASGGNQSAFARDVMKVDSRYVRRWLAGSGMGWKHGRAFIAWRSSKEGKAALLGQRELVSSSSSRRGRKS